MLDPGLVFEILPKSQAYPRGTQSRALFPGLTGDAGQEGGGAGHVSLTSGAALSPGSGGSDEYLVSGQCALWLSASPHLSSLEAFFPLLSSNRPGHTPVPVSVSARAPPGQAPALPFLPSSSSSGPVPPEWTGLPLFMSGGPPGRVHLLFCWLFLFKRGHPAGLEGAGLGWLGREGVCIGGGCRDTGPQLLSAWSAVEPPTLGPVHRGGADNGVGSTNGFPSTQSP